MVKKKTLIIALITFPITLGGTLFLAVKMGSLFDFIFLIPIALHVGLLSGLVSNMNDKTPPINEFAKDNKTEGEKNGI